MQKEAGLNQALQPCLDGHWRCGAGSSLVVGSPVWRRPPREKRVFFHLMHERGAPSRSSPCLAKLRRRNRAACAKYSNKHAKGLQHWRGPAGAAMANEEALCHSFGSEVMMHGNARARGSLYEGALGSGCRARGARRALS